jgi:hypothetical protein
MSNTYNTSCTPNLGGVSEYYTRQEISNLLAAKANKSQVYGRGYLDAEFLELDGRIDDLSSTQVTQSELDTQLGGLETSILEDVEGLYALKTEVYTQQEVNDLIAGIDLDPSSYIRTSPENDSENTIYPGTKNATPLTLRGSSTNPFVQRWLANNTDLIGYVSNNGSVLFERTLEIGRLVSDGETALDVNSKRISFLGDPTHRRDAVPLGYLQDYVLGFFDVSQPVSESIADYVNSVLDEHLTDPDAHEQYEKIENLGTAAYTDSTDYATSAQGDLADSAIQPGDPALSDAREWTAETISESEAREGTATTRRAFTSQRARQAAEGWWVSGTAKPTPDVIDTSSPLSLSQLSISLGIRAFGIGVPGQALFGAGPVAFGDFPLAITPSDYFPIDPKSGSFV